MEQSKETLVEFIDKITQLLLEEADRALKIPNFEGLEWAAYLIDDAQKYRTAYPYAIGINNEVLFQAAEKFKKWNTVNYSNG